MRGGGKVAACFETEESLIVLASGASKQSCNSQQNETRTLIHIHLATLKNLSSAVQCKVCHHMSSFSSLHWHTVTCPRTQSFFFIASTQGDLPTHAVFFLLCINTRWPYPHTQSFFFSCMLQVLAAFSLYFSSPLFLACSLTDSIIFGQIFLIRLRALFLIQSSRWSPLLTDKSQTR